MLKKILENNEHIKSNTRTLNILKEYFPDCFTKDEEFDIERFKNKIASDVNKVDYGYELNFLGKNYANLIASQETTTVIEPDIKHNQKKENKNSNNIYISGDNLDAIKHLLNSYSKKIKCIYIDPPYNTNNDDFVYNDSFNFSKEELMNKLDISEEKAEKLMSFLSRKSSSHSAWLTFMYPRLLLSRDLLTDDGVIFISIDDNEQANLKLLCDSIFGEENMLYQLTVVNSLNGNDNSSGMMETHEYCIFYAKNKALIKMGELSEDDDNRNKWNVDDIGYWKEGRGLKATGEESAKENRETMFFPIYINEKNLTISIDKKEGYTYELYPMTDNKEMRWTWSKENFRENYYDVIVKKNQNGYTLYKKQRPSLKEILSVKGKTIFYKPHYSTGTSTQEIKQIFNGIKLFNYTKSKYLIKDLLLLANIDKNDIVLDFFGGTATTAHAVMYLNNIDNGCLQYIIVQLPENIDDKKKLKSQTKQKQLDDIINFLDSESVKRPHTLDQIGIERIIRVARNITNEYIDKGFKHFTLKTINDDMLDKIKEFNINNNNINVENNIEEEFGIETILTTWINQDGYGLTANYSKINFGEYEAYYVHNESLGGNLYLINKDIDETFIEKLIDKIKNNEKFNIKLIVIFGYNFTYSEMQMIEKNISQLKNSGLNLNIAIDKRY